MPPAWTWSGRAVIWSAPVTLDRRVDGADGSAVRLCAAAAKTGRTSKDALPATRSLLGRSSIPTIYLLGRSNPRNETNNFRM